MKIRIRDFESKNIRTWNFHLENFYTIDYYFIIKFFHELHGSRRILFMLNFNLTYKYRRYEENEKTVELILFVVTKFVEREREREKEEWNRNGIRKRKLICSSVESPLQSFIIKNRISCSIQCKWTADSLRTAIISSKVHEFILHSTARWMRWTHRGKINIQICITATESRRTLAHQLFLLFLLVADAFRFPSNIHPSVDRVSGWGGEKLIREGSKKIRLYRFETNLFF